VAAAVDYFPHVDAHAVAHQRHLIHQPILIMRKVFSSSLTISATCVELTGTNVFERLRVEQPGPPRYTPASSPPHFGNVRSGTSDCLGPHALRGEAQEEIAAHFRPDFDQHGSTSSSVSPGVRGRFQNDQHPRMEVPGNLLAGGDDIAHIRISGLCAAGWVRRC